MTLSSCATDHFVRVDGRQFVRDQRTWYVCGTNLWYGANLGAPSNPEGRVRLVRELDRLQKIGVNNLRVLGASEACAVAGTVRPAIQKAPGVYNEDALEGLDFLIQEAGRRHMTLVVFLNNFWDWSGGMPQYLAWVENKPAQGLRDLPWWEYNRHLSEFYGSAPAQAWYRQYIAMIINRVNTLSGVRYRDDPTIMTWELANEPRPGVDQKNEPRIQPFIAWVDGTAAYIHQLDPHHLVTTGSEGIWGGLDNEANFLLVHRSKSIDYAVFHLWPNNWKWFHADRYQETIGPTLTKAREYAEKHFALGAALGKPTVLEEFGLDRDGGFTVDVGVSSRDRYYAEMFAVIEQSVHAGGAAAGSNFWLWGGEGRPPPSGQPLAAGQIGTGDMPQEPPGLNTVYDSDQSTLKILGDHYVRLEGLRRPKPQPRRAASRRLPRRSRAAVLEAAVSELPWRESDRDRPIGR